MPQIATTETFDQLFRRLPKDVQRKVIKALRLLAENPRHPSLRAKPIEGAPGIFEARVDVHYRMTYERLAGDVLLLRVVARHDDALKNP